MIRLVQPFTISAHDAANTAPGTGFGRLCAVVQQQTLADSSRRIATLCAEFAFVLSCQSDNTRALA